MFADATTDSTICIDISKLDECLQELTSLYYAGYVLPTFWKLYLLLPRPGTKFKRGGFVLGLANQHSMFDGLYRSQRVEEIME